MLRTIVRVSAVRRFAWSDLVYALLYASGVYGLVLWPPIANAITTAIAPIDGVERVPPLFRGVMAFIAFDFCAYWVHRIAHENRLLWFFHRVHHRSPDLGPLTTFRFHVVEFGWRMALQFLPLYVLSIEAAVPPVLVLAFVAFEMTAHSAIDWDFGRLRLVLVSPVYHAIHHQRDQHANFAMFLPVWDVFFGTTGYRGQSQPKTPAASNA